MIKTPRTCKDLHTLYDIYSLVTHHPSHLIFRHFFKWSHCFLYQICLHHHSPNLSTIYLHITLLYCLIFRLCRSLPKSTQLVSSSFLFCFLEKCHIIEVFSDYLHSLQMPLIFYLALYRSAYTYQMTTYDYFSSMNGRLCMFHSVIVHSGILSKENHPGTKLASVNNCKINEWMSDCTKFSPLYNLIKITDQLIL